MLCLYSLTCIIKRHLNFLLYFTNRALLPLLCIFVVSCSYTPPELIEQKTDKPFDKVVQDALFAITEHNFRITGNLKIGEAIRESGNQQFPLYQNILFCNLTYTEQMLSLDARSIYFCPYKVSVREADGSVIVGTVLLPENHGKDQKRRLARKINKILNQIVYYAAADNLPAIEDER